MTLVQILLCIFAISSILCINHVQARSARRLKAEGIQGGIEGYKGQFPYQVSMRIDPIGLCGGSILSNRFIITAAHCVVRPDGQFIDFPIKVIAGTNDLTSSFDDTIEANVSEVSVPTEYDPTVTAYKQRPIGDIAVLKLDKDLDIEGHSNLGKVTLPRSDESFDDVRATVSGFGYNKIDIVTDPVTKQQKEVNGRGLGILRYAKANVITNAECTLFFDVVRILDQHLCAPMEQHPVNQLEGLCTGDSGGPLVYNGTLIGIVSGSPVGCREDSKPAIYTRVSKYYHFITAVMNEVPDSGVRSTSVRFPTLSIRQPQN